MKTSALAGLLFLSFKLFAQSFESWNDHQFQSAKKNLLQNISAPGTIPGTVVASPSKHEPDYYYHWIRDAALVMLTIDRLGSKSDSLLEQDDLKRHLFDFADLTRIQQQKQTPAGLGEVKYHVDGNPFTGSWGRPQNDGPALRAFVFTKLANQLLKNNGEAYVRSVLYDGRMPSDSIIKKDLEYVSHNWNNHDFDLWEESLGHHFFTRLVQRRALIEGATLARRLGDSGAGDWYESQARALEVALNLHWDESRGFFKSTLNRIGGIDYKQGMDSSVIIAIINSDDERDPTFKITDDRFLSSVHKMNETFGNIYSINRNNRSLGTAIGRYPEDQYDGYNTGKTGNPWFLATSDFANFHYKLARAYKREGKISVTKRGLDFFQSLHGVQAQNLRLAAGTTLGKGDAAFNIVIKSLREAGDNYLKRIKTHATDDGALSEQMNRESGYMQGAPHLTWSYASYINAYLSRLEAK